MEIVKTADYFSVQALNGGVLWMLKYKSNVIFKPQMNANKYRYDASNLRSYAIRILISLARDYIY